MERNELMIQIVVDWWVHQLQNDSTRNQVFQSSDREDNAFITLLRAKQATMKEPLPVEKILIFKSVLTETLHKKSNEKSVSLFTDFCPSPPLLWVCEEAEIDPIYLPHKTTVRVDFRHEKVDWYQANGNKGIIFQQVQ